MKYRYQNKRNKNIFLRIIFSKIFVIICLFVLGFSSISLGKEMMRKYRVNKEIKELQAEINNFEKDNYELTQLFEYIKTENFIEREARLKMGYKKNGENVVVIPTLDNNQDQDNDFDNNTEDVSNPIKWFKYFFKF